MLPLRGKYIFPNTVIHFDVSRSRSVKAIEKSMEHDQLIFLNNQIILLMLQPELKFRRDKIRYLMAQQGIDAALIACNVNLLYTYGEIVNGYLYLPLHSPALLFVKRPNNIVGEFEIGRAHV